MSSIGWKQGISGDWTTGADWAGGVVPTAADAVSIAAAGTYEVTLFGAASAASLTLNDAGATFYDAGSLALSGTLALQAGTLALAYGTLSGGTLAMAGGALLATGGTLDGTHVQGTLDLSAANSTLFIRDGLMLAGAGGSGTGSIALTGGYADLAFQGSQTLDHASVSFGAASAIPGQGGAAILGVSHSATATTGATLMLGAGLLLHETGGLAEIAAGSTGPMIGATLADAVVNQGTITADTAGGTLLVAGSGSFINQGAIVVLNGAVIEIDSAGFSNTGSISLNHATLGLGGTFSAQRLSSLGSLTLSNAKVQITGTATNAGGTLTVGSSSALGAITLAGTILGGTVLDTGNGFSFAAGTGILDGVTYQGSLSLGGAGGAVTLTDGAHIVASGGAPGSISVTGAGAALLLRGAETLDYAAISLGNAGQAATIGTSDAFLASTATTATLGSHLTVTQTGLDAALAANAFSALPGFGLSDTMVNQGTITGAIAGGTLALSGYGTFVNQGTIGISNGDTLAVGVRSFANAGTLNVSGGATALLGSGSVLYGAVPVWSNAGLIAVNGGTLVLGGAMSTAQFGSIAVSGGGRVTLAGTLSNAGSTLTLAAGARGLGSLAAASLSGTIQGGTISDAASLLSIGAGTTALLDGVSYAGTLGLTQSGAYLRVRDALSITGAANVTGAASILAFQGTQTFDHAHVSLGNSGSGASIDVLHDYLASGDSTLTLGTGLSIGETGAFASIGLASDLAGDAIVNLGAISGSVAGGILSIGGAGFTNRGNLSVSNGETLALSAAVFSNAGTISATNASLSIGDSVTLAGLGRLALSNTAVSVSGTLDSTGTTLALGAGSLFGQMTLSGTLRGGVIADAGQGLICEGNASLDGVTYRGTLDLSRPFSQLALADGFVITDSTGTQQRTINVTGAGSRLVTRTTMTLDHTTIMLGSAGTLYAGQHIAAAELAASAGTTLTIGAGCAVLSASLVGTLGDAAFGQWTDGIVNDGQILSSTPLGTLTLGSSIFSNAGTIVSSATGGIIDAATSFTNTGTITVNGGGSTFLISLYNHYAAPNAGPNVFTNAGTIQMGGGLFQELTSNGLFPAVPVQNLAGARIQGYGVTSALISNAGTIEARGGQLVLLQAPSGNGALLIDPGATMEFGSSTPASEIVTFTNTGGGGTLKIDQPTLFASPIAGFTTGDVIDLPGLQLSSVGISSGTLVASTATQNFRFATTTPVGGALSSGRDSFGGATISITPQTLGVSPPATLAASAPGMLFWASPVGDTFQGLTANFSGDHIGNWYTPDKLDLTDLSSATAHLVYTQGPTSGTLAISDATHSTTVYLAGSFTSTAFHISADGHGGTLVTYT